MSQSFRAYRGIRPVINPVSRLRDEMKMTELVDAWIAARNPAPKTAYATRRIVKRFVSLLGDLGIGEINHTHLFDFRDALAVMPRNLSRFERTASFRLLAAHFMDTNDPRPKVAPTTVGEQLNAIQSHFDTPIPSAGLETMMFTIFRSADTRRSSAVLSRKRK